MNVVVNGARKEYPGARDVALKNASLRVGPAEIYGLVGPNGSGKSTLMSLIAGLSEPTAGCIEICGHRAGTPNAKRRIAYVPDDLPLPELLTGGEYIELCARLSDDAVQERTRALTRAFDLDNWLDEFIGSYSHGMKKRLQFAVAFGTRRPVMILDEPFSGLDPFAAILLEQLIRVSADSGSAVLVSSHDLYLIERLCCSATVLDAGQVLAEGRITELINMTPASNLLEAIANLTAADRAMVDLEPLLTEIRNDGHPFRPSLDVPRRPT